MEIGKLFIIIGILMVVAGTAIALGFRGLPGDIVLRNKNGTFIFPIMTSLVLSLIISLIIYLLRR